MLIEKLTNKKVISKNQNATYKINYRQIRSSEFEDVMLTNLLSDKNFEFDNSFFQPIRTCIKNILFDLLSLFFCSVIFLALFSIICYVFKFCIIFIFLNLKSSIPEVGTISSYIAIIVSAVTTAFILSIRFLEHKKD
jgi:hypothetical protein